MTNLKQKVAQSYKVVLEMLEDRKNLTEEEMSFLRGFGPNEVMSMANKKGTSVNSNANIFNIDVPNKLRIIYYIGKFKFADFKPYYIDEDKEPFDLYILIISEKMTTNHSKYIAEYEESDKIKPMLTNRKIRLQCFDLEEMLFNITKHVLVPKHEVIKDENEIAKLVEAYNIKNKHQFPVILRTDPVARYFDIEPGNLVKITRVSPSSGEYVIYRCCI